MGNYDSNIVVVFIPSGAEMEIFGDTEFSTMAADAPALNSTRSLAHMVLTVLDKQVFVFYK